MCSRSNEKFAAATSMHLLGLEVILYNIIDEHHIGAKNLIDDRYCNGYEGERWQRIRDLLSTVYSNFVLIGIN